MSAEQRNNLALFHSIPKSVSSGPQINHTTGQGALLQQKRNYGVVELHVHLAGACQLQTLITTARERKVPLPYDNMEEFWDCVSLSEPQPSLAVFLKPFGVIQAIIGGSSKALEMVAYDFSKASYEAGVMYSELRFNPPLLALSSLAADKVTLTNNEVMDAIISGLDKGKKEFEIDVNMIICFTTNKPEQAAEMVDLALHYQSKGVVAVDIAGDEMIPMHQLHIDAFKKAKQSGLQVTAHAGEAGPAANVKRAIEVLGAERIGHGYKVLDDEDVYTMAKKSNVHFEVCPLSSIHTGSQKMGVPHAVQRFSSDGVNYSISSDDPCVMRKTLIDDYIIASNEFGLDYKQIKQSVLNGVDAAFLSNDKKSLLKEKVLHRFTEVEKQYSINC